MNPEERLRTVEYLRAEFELPEVSLEDISTSVNEPSSKHNRMRRILPAHIQRTILQHTVKAMFIHRTIPIPYSEETYTEDYSYEEPDVYYEEDPYASTYDSSYRSLKNQITKPANTVSIEAVFSC